MKTVIQHSYGAPDVLSIVDAETPTVGPGDVLVEVHASALTQGDRRLRAADFPGVSAVPGRLMMGVLRPKNPRPGTMFAGRIVAVGADVTRFAVGQDIFGSCAHSAHAELLSVAADSPIALMPEGTDYAEAASAPYGAGTAIGFLEDMARLQRGERLLIVGASGGVGRFAVQLGRHLGAHVTGVCSGRNADLVRQLGADEVIDYTQVDFRTQTERYDVIFDTTDTTGFSDCKKVLTPSGRHLSLYLTFMGLIQMLWTRRSSGPRAIVGVSMGDQVQTERIAGLMAQGVLQPVIDHRFPLTEVVRAHEAVESGGTVVLTIAHGPRAVAAAR